MVGPLCITHLVNFDWATELDKIRSIMGMLLKIGSNLISCNNKLQSIVALSMLKLKYCSMNTTKEITWLNVLLMEFGCLKGMRILSYDNLSSIQLVNNLVHHTRMKLTIELQHHYIRER
jgi:hypothetical protein